MAPELLHELLAERGITAAATTPVDAPPVSAPLPYAALVQLIEEPDGIQKFEIMDNPTLSINLGFSPRWSLQALLTPNIVALIDQLVSLTKNAVRRRLYFAGPNDTTYDFHEGLWKGYVALDRDTDDYQNSRLLLDHRIAAIPGDEFELSAARSAFEGLLLNILGQVTREQGKVEEKSKKYEDPAVAPSWVEKKRKPEPTTHMPEYSI